MNDTAEWVSRQEMVSEGACSATLRKQACEDNQTSGQGIYCEGCCHATTQLVAVGLGFMDDTTRIGSRILAKGQAGAGIEPAGEKPKCGTKAPCVGCGNSRKIIARGLCGLCYKDDLKSRRVDTSPPPKRGPRGTCKQCKRPDMAIKKQGLCGTCTRKADQAQSEPGEETPMAEPEEITLEFEERDEDLLQRLKDMAKQQRRGLEGQIMSILERVNFPEAT